MRKILLIVSVLFCTSTAMQAQKVIKVGDKAPNFTQTSVNGDSVSLAQFKGKMVLLDFWASWCGPCRKENPTVVEAYNTYKGKKFKKGKDLVIISISLDTKHDSWVKAINSDGLIWDTHLSDLKGWKNEVAVQYGVKSIPTNFLIAGDGTILAINLRGEELLNTLKKYKK